MSKNSSRVHKAESNDTLRREGFTILDAMILVCATAIGVTVVRNWFPPAFYRDITIAWPDRAFFASKILSSISLYLAMATVLIRLRRPRPSLRRLGYQPGLVACLSVSLMAFFLLLENAPVLISSKRGLRDELADLLMGVSTHTKLLAPTVAVAWLVLAIGRRWRADPGWIDRLGRFVGLMWLVILSADLLLGYRKLIF